MGVVTWRKRKEIVQNYESREQRCNANRNSRQRERESLTNRSREYCEVETGHSFKRCQMGSINKKHTYLSSPAASITLITAIIIPTIVERMQVGVRACKV